MCTYTEKYREQCLHHCQISQQLGTEFTASCFSWEAGLGGYLPTALICSVDVAYKAMNALYCWYRFPDGL